jgi:hypothetical protein
VLLLFEASTATTSLSMAPPTVLFASASPTPFRRGPLLAWSGETFMLSAEPIWGADVAVAVDPRIPQPVGTL